MRVSSRLFRASVWLASTSLSLASTLPAYAQPSPPDQTQAESGTPGGDPPAIAGRVSDVSGTVSFHAAGDTNWAAATMNYPVTNGEGFWTEPTAHAALQVGDDTVVLAGSTDLEISALDVSRIAATEAQGASFLAIQSLPNGQTLSVDTPRGTVQISTPGRYEIVAGDTNDATTVTVVEGAAHVQGNGVSLDVGPQQTATITGSDTFQGSVGPMQEDEFLRTELNQAKQIQQRVSQLPQEVQYMTGGTALAEAGSFESSEQYGQVWYPREVAPGWAPYREGHWAYVAPWGWNWVDNEPWGFAPFHYGRWVQVGGRWGWCAGAPGVVYGGGYPVYSPALVSFVGVGGALLAGAAFGHGGGIGWFPLGFNEPYYPPYHVSNGYFQNINRFSVTNIRNYNVTNIRNVSVEHFANARFATVMPESAMVRGERVGQFGRPLPVSALAQVHPIFGRPPVAPSAETPNLSRAVAAQYHLPIQHAVARSAPGPVIRPGAEAGRPALRSAAPPAGVRAIPAAAARPGAVPAHGGLPALRQPGAGRPPAEAGREATRPGETARPGEAVARPEARAAGGLPALRAPGAAPPGAERREGTAATHEAARPEAHEAARPEARAAARPETRPENRAATRQENHEAARPESHEAARPETRAEPAARAPERSVARTEAHHAEAPRPEAARPQAARPEAARPEPARAEPHREAAPREAAPHQEARPAEEHHAAARPADHHDDKRDEHH